MISTWDRAVGTVEKRARAAQSSINRATLAPAVVRLAVFVAGAAAFLLADPKAWFLLFLALMPAVFPRSVWATCVILVASLAWLVTTSANPDQIDTWRLCALAIALYGVHVGCALSAVLPYDAVYTPGIFRPWLVRASVVGAFTVLVGIVVTALPQLIRTGQPVLAATVGGIVLMVTMAIFIAYLGYRRQ